MPSFGSLGLAKGPAGPYHNLKQHWGFDVAALCAGSMASTGGTGVQMCLALPIHGNFLEELMWAFLWMLSSFAVLMVWSKNTDNEHLRFWVLFLTCI